MSQEDFEYSPIQEGHIRLLKILHGKTLSLKIKSFPINRTPEYAALSYTWGGQVPTEPVRINGRVCMITKNLHDALFTLSDDIRDKAHGHCWTDGICINQQNGAEKSVQVALMSEIYKRAMCVVVWLGIASNGSDLALEEIRRSANDFMLSWNASGGKAGTALASVTPRNELLIGDGFGRLPKAWPEIANLLSRSWFTRAWIVQEVSLNGRVNIYCGRNYIEWFNFHIFILARHRLRHHLGTALGVGDGLRIPNYNEAVYCLAQTGCTVLRDGGFPLLEALHKLRIYNCQNSQDKVYAALGLVKGLPVGAIQPDYSKSVVEVYMDVVRYCLRSAAAGHRLDFLGMVVRPAHDSKTLDREAFDVWLDAENEETPTWVPDWRSRVTWSLFPKTFRGGVPIDATVYDASKGSQANINIQDRKLLVRGTFVDYITSVSSINELEDHSFPIQRSWRPHNLHDEYPTGETVSNAFACTLVADVEWYSGLTAMQRGYSADLGILDGWLGKSKGTDSPDSRMQSSIVLATDRRRFIRTEKGYMGLAPAAAAMRDKICVLFGGQVLCVLRQNNDGKTHEFMGECYVHGLMDGQAMDMPTQDNKANPGPEIFVLV